MMQRAFRIARPTAGARMWLIAIIVLVAGAAYPPPARTTADAHAAFEATLAEAETVSLMGSVDVLSELYDLLPQLTSTEKAELEPVLLQNLCTGVSYPSRYVAIMVLVRMANADTLSAASHEQAVQCVKTYTLDPTPDPILKNALVTAMRLFWRAPSLIPALEEIIAIAGPVDAPFVGADVIWQNAVAALGGCGSAGLDSLVAMVPATGLEESLLIPMARSGDVRAYTHIRAYMDARPCDYTTQNCSIPVVALGTLASLLDIRALDPTEEVVLETIRQDLHNLCDASFHQVIVSLAAMHVFRITPDSDTQTIAMLEELRPVIREGTQQQIDFLRMKRNMETQ